MSHCRRDEVRHGILRPDSIWRCRHTCIIHPIVNWSTFKFSWLCSRFQTIFCPVNWPWQNIFFPLAIGPALISFSDNYCIYILSKSYSVQLRYILFCFTISFLFIQFFTLQWRHNERDGVSNPQPHDCLLNRLFRHRSKKTSKFRVTGLCEGNSPVTGEFPSQRPVNAVNVSIWWRHHDLRKLDDVHVDELHLSMGIRFYLDSLIISHVYYKASLILINHI